MTTRVPPAEYTADGWLSVRTDLAVVPVFEQDESKLLAEADRAADGELRRALASGELRPKLHEWFATAMTRADGSGGRLLAIGAGPPADVTSDRLRWLASTAVRWARQRRYASLAFVMPMAVEVGTCAQAVTEGLVLGGYDPDAYKTGDRDAGQLDRLIVVGHAPSSGAEDAVRRGRILAGYTNEARMLVNEPGNVLTPASLAERARDLVEPAGIRVEVVDERGAAALGMRLLLGVGRGSAEPPRVIVLHYEPPGGGQGPVLGLVGKGVTFDSGGISIKPAEGMDRMKDDMAGGAAVIAALGALGTLKGPTRVIGVVPAVENMPGSRALKPGDVLKSASGRTVEINNTDAEGRLILADALWYAQTLGATHLVDVATLTGACVVALGKTTTGLFGEPVWWVDRVRAAGERAGDRCWPLPVFEDYREQLRSEIADLLNTGGRPAGAITAAMFLKEFTGGRPWAHLDIAGTAWNDETTPYRPKGPVGVGVRTLAELALEETARWSEESEASSTASAAS